MIPEISQFQIRQDVPDSISVLYVRGPGFAQHILERVRSEISANCRFPLSIEFHEVETIPLERSNKRRFVISRVPF